MGEKGSRAGMREIRRLCTRVDERTCQEQGETGRASSQQGIVADDFGYVCLDQGKRELVNVVDNSKHNAETSHAQRLRQ